MKIYVFCLMLIQTCGWQWLGLGSTACQQHRASMSSITRSSVHWPLRCMQTISLHWLPAMELPASGNLISMIMAKSRRRMCFGHNSLSILHLAVKSTFQFNPVTVPTCRKWCKETFDYLLSHLRSPESVKMGIFCQSGYNLLTEPAPVSSASFSTVD